MRKLSLLIFTAMTLGTLGCSSKSGPADPTKLSAEQIEAANQEQKKADDAERAHLKADPGSNKRPTDSVDEEERRARGGR